MQLNDQSLILQGINACKTFLHLTLEEKTAFAALGTTCHYAQGTTVFSADHHGDAFFIVVSGKLRIRLKSRKIKECKAGAIFGEVAIFDNKTRTGSIHVEDDAILARFEKETLFDSSLLSSDLKAKVLTGITRQIISYLYEELPVSSLELIMKGESDTVEFKASTSEKHFPKIIETAAAMMNSHGGVILLGVEDSGGLYGIKLSHTERDVLVRKINMLMRSHLGEYPATLVHIDAEIVDGREIIRIDCEPSTVPVFVTEDEKETLYIRVSRENTQIRTLRDCIQYIKKRFTEMAG